MIQIHVYIEEKQKEALKNISASTGAPVSEIMRRALSAYLKQPEVNLMLKYRTPQRQCLYCGADRTGQDSLIATPGGEVFCDEAHYDKWREKQQENANL